VNKKQYKTTLAIPNSPMQWHWLAVALLLCSVVFQDKGYNSNTEASVSYVSNFIADVDEEVSETYDFDDFTFEAPHSVITKVSDLATTGTVIGAVKLLRHDSQARAPPA
jgi:hypothetical protein